MMKKYIFFFALALALVALPFANGQSPVLILAENLQQVVTSSTLVWIPANSKQPINLQNAVIGAYQIMQDELDEENSAFPSVPKEPVYVCRAHQNGIWVSGQLRPNNPRCITSLRGNVEHFDRYEVLINIEAAANLTWATRNKYTLNPQGAVTGGDEPFRNFIARRKANSHNKEGSLTYFLGKFDPNDNLGRYSIVDQNDEQLEYEDGEILVETEPIGYEVTGIKLDYSRKRSNQDSVVLGSVVLKNEYGSEEVDRVDAVISYRYNYTLYWGHGHGLLTGLPVVIRLQNGSTLREQWGVPKTVEKLDTAPIESFLMPGTAVNVTLRGNYGEWDTPYTAVITSLYKGGGKMDRLVKDSQREHSMRDVISEFGPVYFLHNNSIVPVTTTTTTTTTTTRTTTTFKTTTTTEDAVPISPPEVIEIPANNLDPQRPHQPGNSANGNEENSIMISDDGGAQSLQNKDQNVKPNQGGTAASVTSSMAILILGIICVRKIT